MKTILVPLDGSELAAQVVPYVRLLAPLFGAEAHLLGVITREIARHMIVTDTSEPCADSLKEINQQRAQQALAEAYLLEQAQALRAHRINVTTEVCSGSPAETIVEVAAREPDTLIAMATHGYNGLRRWTVGSVADKVVHAAPMPILLVRGTAATSTAPVGLQRILVPLDGSAFSELALPLALEFASRAQAELNLLRVLPPPIEFVSDLSPFDPSAPSHLEFPNVLRDRALQQLAATIERCCPPGVPATPAVAMGYPAEEIVDEAVQRRVDLIVMATHGASGLGHWALGSVADKVLHASTSPLLLVR